MNYSPVLEAQQKTKKVSQEVVNLVSEILKKDILSIKIKPGSFSFDTFGAKQNLEFVGEINEGKVYGNIIINYKNNNKDTNRVCDRKVDSLEFKVDGPMRKFELIFDNNLNIISCVVSFLMKADDSISFLRFDKVKEDCARLNYYDREASDVVKCYICNLIEKKSAKSYSDCLNEEYFAYHGLMPDKETKVEFASQEELLDIVNCVFNKPEVTDKMYRGELKLIKDNKDRKNLEN